MYRWHGLGPAELLQLPSRMPYHEHYFLWVWVSGSPWENALENRTQNSCGTPNVLLGWISVSFFWRYVDSTILCHVPNTIAFSTANTLTSASMMVIAFIVHGKRSCVVTFSSLILLPKRWIGYIRVVFPFMFVASRGFLVRGFEFPLLHCLIPQGVSKLHCFPDGWGSRGPHRTLYLLW